MNHAVVEVDTILTILNGTHGGPGFLEVWNLYHAIFNTSSGVSIEAICNADSVELRDNSFCGPFQIYKLPPPDTSRIFQRPCSGRGAW